MYLFFYNWDEFVDIYSVTTLRVIITKTILSIKQFYKTFFSNVPLKCTFFSQLGHQQTVKKKKSNEIIKKIFKK